MPRHHQHIEVLYTTHRLTSDQLHGFTGSGKVFKRNITTLSKDHYVVVPDLRGHGSSDKPKSGYHVARLAMDLNNLINHLKLAEGQISAIGTSLGAAILWYAQHNHMDISKSKLTYRSGAMANCLRQKPSHTSYSWIKRLCKTISKTGVQSSEIAGAILQKLCQTCRERLKMIRRLLIWAQSLLALGTDIAQKQMIRPPTLKNGKRTKRSFFKKHCAEMGGGTANSWQTTQQATGGIRLPKTLDHKVKA